MHLFEKDNLGYVNGVNGGFPPIPNGRYPKNGGIPQQIDNDPNTLGEGMIVHYTLKTVD